MNISTRFTEFGMTGAFFWISQIVFFSYGYDLHLMNLIPQWFSDCNDCLIKFPKELQSAAGSLVTVFGVIGIFVTGLLLDLVGSYFALLEMTIFNRHLKRNQDWLNILSDQCPKSIQRDYQMLLDDFGTDYFVSLKKILKRIGMAREYKYIQTFLFSYIHVFSSMSGMLVDNRHLWRTSRAISTTLLILAVEVIGLYFSLRHNSNGSLPYWAIILHLAFFGGSAFITLRSYSRLCISLFSLACATQKKESAALLKK